MEILKKLAWVTLIKDFRVQRLHKRSEVMIERFWGSFKSYETGRLIIPPDWLESYEAQKDKWSWERLAAGLHLRDDGCVCGESVRGIFRQPFRLDLRKRLKFALDPDSNVRVYTGFVSIGNKGEST